MKLKYVIEIEVTEDDLYDSETVLTDCQEDLESCLMDEFPLAKIVSAEKISA